MSPELSARTIAIPYDAFLYFPCGLAWIDTNVLSSELWAKCWVCTLRHKTFHFSKLYFAELDIQFRYNSNPRLNLSPPRLSACHSQELRQSENDVNLVEDADWPKFRLNGNDPSVSKLPINRHEPSIVHTSRALVARDYDLTSGWRYLALA